MIIKQKSLKSNFIFNSVLTASSLLFPLIIFPYVSRILGPVGIGKISFTSSVIYYFNIIAQLGVPTYGIRACAKVREDKDALSQTIHEILIINLIMCLLSYFCFFCSLLLVPKFYENKELMIITSLTIIFNTIGVEWLYKALEEYAYITFRSIIFKIISLFMTFVLIHQKSDYVLYGCITIIASVGSNIFNFYNLKKYVVLSSHTKLNLKKHIKAIGIFFAMSIATTIYTNLDNVMLGFIKSDSDVGYYNAAIKIKSILVSLVTSIGTVLLPRSSYYIENGLLNDFKNITRKSLNFVIVFGISATTYFTIFSKEGILFLFGSDYINSIIPMQIIMPTVFFIGLTNILGIQILIPLGKEMYVLYSEIIGAIINLIINVILIPKFAAGGAALGTLTAEIIVFIVQFLALKKFILPILKEIYWKKICFSLFSAAVVAIIIKNTFVTSYFIILFVSACIFYIIYIGLLIKFDEPLTKEIKKYVISLVLHKMQKQ